MILTSLSLGVALLLAALLFNRGGAIPLQPQAVATPTVDRLARPTLPAVASQADRGAQVYWLSCLPCHGDRGQGLTDEFRQLYPPEDRNCWSSGCHGERPYDHGFKLPKTVPALIGPGALQKFSDAAALHSFIAAAMPFWKPGSLSAGDSWSVTAFLLRQNGLWDARTELNSSNAPGIHLGASPAAASVPSPPGPLFTLAIAGALALIGLLSFVLLRRKPPRT